LVAISEHILAFRGRCFPSDSLSVLGCRTRLLCRSGDRAASTGRMTHELENRKMLLIWPSHCHRICLQVLRNITKHHKQDIWQELKDSDDGV
jgi:hypothetical protein